ncbi:hypothetical protein N8291_06490 [Pseudomonadales bacterium]|nr:hypothetical protein [Pseudomonadales bacterium]
MSSLMLFFKKVISLKRHLVKLDHVRTPFGEPFNEDNHWVKTLREYDLGLRDFTKSSLYDFHQRFKPVNIFDTTPDGETRLDSFFLGEYPWGRWARKTSQKEWFEGTHCGPSSEENIEKEWNDFIALYHKIVTEGLRVEEYGCPLGCFLIDEDKVNYFIVLGGNHRMAIISHLNLLKKVSVRAIARNDIQQFSYFRRLKIKYPRPGLDLNKTRQLFKHLVSPEFIIYEK